MEEEQPRRRVGRGRSRLGCSVCKARRKKCDEGQPSCKNCLDSGRICDGPRTRGQPAQDIRKDDARTSSLAILSPSVYRNELEGKTFTLFVERLAPQLSGYQDKTFWMGSVLAAAHNHESVLTATLAMVHLYDLPMVETLPRVSKSSSIVNRYQNAIEWYCQSMNASRSELAPSGELSLPNLTLLLLNTILYLHVEIRQAHHQNLSTLACAAFGILYSARSTLMKTNDATVLACVSILVDFPVTMAIDCTKIPQHQWVYAITLGLKMAVTQPNPEEYLIRFELFNILYDVNKAVSTFDTKSYGPLEERLQTWSRRLIEYQKICTLAFQFQAYRLRQHFLSDRTQLQLLCGEYIDRKIIKDSISEMMVMNESLAVRTSDSKNGAPISSWLMEAGVIPSCIHVAWFARYVMMSPPIRRTLLRYRIDGSTEYLPKVIDYCEALACSDPTESTPFIRDVFGEDLKIPRRLHLHMITHRLVRGNSSIENGT